MHAYYVACPWCGFMTLHLQSEAGFAEDGEAESRGSARPGGPEVAFRHPRLVRAREELVCPACRKGARLIDGQWAFEPSYPHG